MLITDFLEPTIFEKFLTFIKGKDFNTISKYYIEYKLHLVKSPPALYKFTSPTGKLYYGKADDLFQRLNDYIKMGNINNDLKDDLMENTSYFSYQVVTEYMGEKVTISNIFKLEAEATAAAKSKGKQLYNKTNLTKKLGLGQARKCKKIKIIKDDYKGFEESMGFII